MSNSPLFDWHTEEDGRWEDAPAGNTTTLPNQPTKWPRRLAILTIFLALIGLTVYLLLENRVNTANEAIKTEVLGSHTVVQQAINQQDIDLLDAYFDKRSATIGWIREQRRGIETETTWMRSGFGFFIVDEPASEPTVELSADLGQATVQFEQAYEVIRPDGTPATTTLQHTTHYLQDEEGRWLYTIPSDEFWGDTQTFAGNHLTLHYPTRDAIIAQRLANDLDTALSISCTDTLCSPITLTLGIRNDYYFQQIGLGHFFSSEMELPTITLVGYPLDDIGYNNIYRHYLMAALIQMADQRQDYTYGLNDATLDNMGLLDWPRSVPAPSGGEVSLPTVAVSCPAGSGQDLWTYNQTTTQWDALPLAGSVTTFQSHLTPAGGGLVMKEDTAGGNRFSLWQDGETRTLWEIPLTPTQQLWASHTSPNGRYWVFVQYEEQAPTSSEWIPPLYYILDSADCDPAGCNVWTVEGYPKWSPDGQHTLIEQFTDGYPAIWLGDPAGQNLQERHVGWGVNWLDNQTYLYQDGSRAIYIGSVDDPMTYTYLSLESLNATLPSFLSQDWFISNIRRQGDHSLLISVYRVYGASSSSNDTVYTLRLIRDPAWQPAEGGPPGELTYLGRGETYTQLPGRDQTMYGGWFATLQNTTNHYQLTLTHPSRAEQTYTYPYLLPFNISAPQLFTNATQDWLLVSQLGHLHFVNPSQTATVGQHLVMPDYTCQFAGWLE